MANHYRFRIQQLRAGRAPRFQLRVGLAGEPNFELVPVHRTAFAKKLPLEVAHPSQVDAQLELTALLEWLSARPGSQNTDFIHPGG